MRYLFKHVMRLSWNVAGRAGLAGFGLLVGGACTDASEPTTVDVVALRLLPQDPQVVMGDSLDFVAFGLTAAGDTVELEVTWSTTQGEIQGKGKGQGLYTPRGSGMDEVTASADTLADSATVTVLPAAPVITAPSEGATLATATPTIAGTAEGSASVEVFVDAGSAGTVTATAGGNWTYTLTAAQALAEGPHGAFAIATGGDGNQSVPSTTVSFVTVPSPASANECQTPDPAWIWCDDFEQDRLGAYFEYINPGGNSFVREAGVGTEGSYGMRVHFEEGQVNAGALHLAFGRSPDAYFRPVDAGTADYREIYYRMYLKHQVGWADGGGHKLSRATVFAGSPTSSWAQAMIAHLWSGNSRLGGTNTSRYYLVMDPASGTDEAGNVLTTRYNDFDNLRWLGRVQGQMPLFDSDHVGRWYCVEVHVRLNDAGSSNGIFEFWIDDRLEARKENMNWLGSYDEYGINAVFFENYWNSPGSHQTQERFFDGIVVSTARIGCGG